MYEMIFKRKSFHVFRNSGKERLTEQELEGIRTAYENRVALDPDIKTAIRIVPADEKVLGRGAEYAVEIYSEKKDNYLANAGYIGEQLDLYLVSKNIGSLWFGLGKPEEREYNGLSFVIMILIAKVDSSEKFRKDVFKCKRKSVEELWQGQSISGVSDIARFAPSACNSQPWRIKRNGDMLEIYRYRRPGKIGIMPAAMVSTMNRIDMGIFLYFLELCLQHEKIEFSRKLFVDEGSDDMWTLNAEYNIADKEVREKFEFRDIRPEETEQAIAIEQICFPPNEACSPKAMKERIAKVPELFLVAVDKATGKIAGFLNGVPTQEYRFRDEFFTDSSLCEDDGKNVMLLGLDEGHVRRCRK